MGEAAANYPTPAERLKEALIQAEDRYLDWELGT